MSKAVAYNLPHLQVTGKSDWIEGTNPDKAPLLCAVIDVIEAIGEDELDETRWQLQDILEKWIGHYELRPESVPTSPVYTDIGSAIRFVPYPEKDGGK